MKRVIVFFSIIFLMLLSTISFAQNRKSQKELFGGVAFSLSPELFKSSFKMGISPHFQFVIFPKDKLGISFGIGIEFFTFDENGFTKMLAKKYNATESAIRNVGEFDDEFGNLEFSLGLRPYLTPVESNIQFFILGSITYNLLDETGSFTSAIDDPDLQDLEGKWENNVSKIGFATGAGFEIPAGGRFNLIVQGLVRFISSPGWFSENKDTLVFVSITAGIAF
jgi:hypothetical protein